VTRTLLEVVPHVAPLCTRLLLLFSPYIKMSSHDLESYICTGPGSSTPPIASPQPISRPCKRSSSPHKRTATPQRNIARPCAVCKRQHTRWASLYPLFYCRSSATFSRSGWTSMVIDSQWLCRKCIGVGILYGIWVAHVDTECRSKLGAVYPPIQPINLHTSYFACISSCPRGLSWTLEALQRCND
jgi:hypothetical protein